jgi:hypothetical protein
VLIAIGGSMLIRRSDPKGRFWAWTFLILGVWLLLNTLGIVRVGFWQLFWPLVLVFLGMKLVSQAISGSTSTFGAMRTGVSSGGLVAVMSEAKRANTDRPFRGTQMTAIMGGCQLDLRQATLQPGEEAVIDVFALMGGGEIFVPTTWVVISEVVPIMAGIEDKRLPALSGQAAATAAVPETPPRLVVRGYLIMGGLSLKN